MAFSSIREQEGHTGEGMLTLQECPCGPLPEGWIDADQNASASFYTQLSCAGFWDVENKGKLVTRATLIIFLPACCIHKSDVKKKMLSSFSVSPKLGVSKLHFKKRYLKLILVWYRLVTVKLIKLINWNHTLNQVRFWLGAHVCGQWSLNVSFSLWWVLNAFKAKGKCVRMWVYVRMSTYVR